MSRISAALLALLLVSVQAVLGPQSAHAQQDPRVTAETIAVLQALLALRDAQIKALTEDKEKAVAEAARCAAPPEAK